MFDGGQEKRLLLEVDQDQRWYIVTEHRLARSRSFFRSGVNSPPKGAAAAAAATAAAVGGRAPSPLSLNDTDANFSDASSCCSSSFSSTSSDLESSLPFEKINLTWTPPPKGSKRGSKRFSSFNPLKDVVPSLSLPTTTPSSPSESCATTPLSLSASSSPTTTATSTSPTSETRSPVIGFADNKSLSNKSSSSSLNGGSGTKTYEHLPALDGCIHLDLGSGVSPSTLLLPLRRATLGIDPDEMRDHLANLMSCPSAVTSELTAMVSFPDLELRPVRTHVAYVGQGRRETLSIVECWTDEDDDDSDSTLVEVDEDGLAL
ncbi:hypothetical protein BGZ65_011908, partial [Modicella reniformis]